MIPSAPSLPWGFFDGGTVTENCDRQTEPVKFGSLPVFLPMKRRHLLKYGTFAAWGYGLTACNRLPDTVRLPGRSAKQANLESTPPVLDLSAPEKQTLTLGYVPDLAIAPWLMALTQGFFEQYGLEVELYPQVDQQAVEQGLLESRFDAAITSFSTPLIYQLKSPRVDLVALMQIHRHGGVFCGRQQTWADNIRSGIDYANFAEFAAAYRDYVRALPEKTFGVDHDYSTTAYLYRYWWAALGFHPDRDLELVTFAPTELRHKLQAGLIQGYCSQEPWGQEAIATDSGFIQYLSGDIWQGHPGPVITTSAGWLEENPNTAKALIAATLQGCQYCQDPTNAATIGPLLASNLDLDPAALTALFSGQYFYGGDGDRPIARRDSPIWFDQGRRITAPDQANYCWQSHGLWLLTQMVRWRHFELRQYPQNARELVAAAYPSEPYGAIAQGFGLRLPPESFKSEIHFIDQRAFLPNQVASYLNQFKIRT
ncbi:CmpA/NrtA family ABC transporter substrate-binding protein [Synechococcus sp. BDU 130192]|uniref:CmpA/NrtA family ABC transporter substrate-binding protein n=2 Tax=Synechococcus sp. BDU 130192 TaxID=2042059 RepID=UPI001C1F6527|nr:CmpA/NrtA family ABC transporter substrate-binding protein [Synechococcus sp. BDU 130192]